MCGIFGLVIAQTSASTPHALQSLIRDLADLSASRGSEASGLALVGDDAVDVYRQAASADRMVRDAECRHFLRRRLESSRDRGCVLIGHSRLVTNGSMQRDDNNQPVVAGDLIGVHNGIICNDDALWLRHPELEHEHDIDTEVLLRLIGSYVTEDGSLATATRRAFAEIEGVANVAALTRTHDALLLATNNGSLYVAESGGAMLFASEEYIARTAAEGARRTFGDMRVSQVTANSGCLIDFAQARVARFSLSQSNDPVQLHGETAPRSQPRRVVVQNAPAPRGGEMTILASTKDRPTPDWLIDEYERNRAAIARLRRCTRCVQPETIPFLRFDAEGVCDDCRNHVPYTPLGAEALRQAVAKLRRLDGRPEVLLPLSGGRDSSYALHYVKQVLDLNPIAYTYDWGMVTDLARRNMSRLCQKLGVEHIIVSADIARKRRYVRENVRAWLKQPDLGMIPLFMAGDKQFYCHGDRLCRRTGIEAIIFAVGRLELTRFKAGYCDVPPQSGAPDSPGSGGSGRMIWHYLKNFAKNPGYLNTSLGDTAVAYFCYYLMPFHQRYLTFDDYIEWNEGEIIDTLTRDYGWERATDTTTTWRIGDGTVPFYNYVYYTVGGFTEHDTFRSNQIRAGMIDRERALALVEEHNRPRYPSMAWYCETIGLDVDEALRVVHRIPKTYRV